MGPIHVRNSEVQAPHEPDQPLYLLPSMRAAVVVLNMHLGVRPAELDRGRFFSRLRPLEGWIPAFA